MALVKKACDEYKLQPLILLRDTIEIDLPENTTYHRSMKLWNWLQKEYEYGKVMIIPDIQGFFYDTQIGFDMHQIRIDLDKNSEKNGD